MKSGIHPDGYFITGVHEPACRVANLRESDPITVLGEDETGRALLNQGNFPTADVAVEKADTVYEAPNAFPFKGVTYIAGPWAEARARDPSTIRLPPPAPVSLRAALDHLDEDARARFLDDLPLPLKLALAQTGTDPADLIALAQGCCGLMFDAAREAPAGLLYDRDGAGRLRPRIHQPDLFEVLANNPHLPESYRKVMVLLPGAQGESPIVGESGADNGHVWEYLRANSYIPWGHYAANMAEDAVRYSAADLTQEDMRQIRRLYYQRTYLRLAQAMGLAEMPESRRRLSGQALEALRQRICAALEDPAALARLPFTATLWGWNYGFDYAPTGYRLHASHQQIHQQYALVPDKVRQIGRHPAADGFMPSFGCGDMIQDFIAAYRRETGKPFFAAYLLAIAGNRRMDGRSERPQSLVVHEDEHAVLFAPKAQTSQWELQLMLKAPVGNIVETLPEQRAAVDRGIWTALTALTRLGARMVTSIEYPKRIGAPDAEQHLLYAFLPKLPHSPGGFSEAQLRWINGHFPEDFASAARAVIS